MQRIQSRNDWRRALLQSGAAWAVLAAATSAHAQDAPSPAADNATEQTQGEEGGIRDIVVTARKQGAESVQRVPIAITAIDTTFIKQAQATSIVDVGRLAPNVQLQTAGTWPGVANFTIRGMAYNNSLRTLDPTVSIIVDGMPYGDSMGTLLDTFDLGSIEVLRGPQGVLIGKNSTGGAVNVRTRLPAREFNVEGTVRVGNGGRFDQSLLVEGPITPELRGKIAILHRKSNGLSEDRNGGSYVVAPQNPTGTNPADTYQGAEVREDSWTFRPVLAYESGNFNASLVFEYITAKFGGNNSRILNPKPVLLDQFGYTPPLNGYEINHDVESRADLETYRANLEMNLDLGFGTLTSVTGYRHLDEVTTIDNDGVPFLFHLYPDNTYGSKQFVQEIRFAAKPADNVKLLIGGFYSHTNLTSMEQRQYLSILSSTTPPYTYRYQHLTYDQNADVLAAFANVDWEAFAGVTLSGGLRFTHENKNINMVPFQLCAGPGFTNCPDVATFAEKAWNDVSPRIAINYQATPDILLYGSWTKGFRSGNFNGRAAAAAGIGPSAPEKASSFEVGIKSTLFDRHVRLNIAGFYTKFDDIQKVLTASNGVQSILNAANATIYGLEAELTVQPVDGLQLDGAFGWTHARYDQFNGLDLTGDGIPDPDLAKLLLFERVPEYSLTVGGSYRFAVPGLPGELTARTSYAYKSSMYVNLVNTPSMRVPSFGLWDASLTYEPNEHLRITAYGRNLGNTQYWDTGVNFNWGDALFGGEARSFGVELGFKF